jgi:hypothetical protein
VTPEPAPEKPRNQVVEETRETLTLLDQDRLTRERKLAQEGEPMQEGHEVRFAERHFAPRHGLGIEEIRDRVDALEVKRRLPPEAPLPPIEVPAPPPREHVREDHRAALTPLVEGEIVSIEVVYRAGRGDVVEAVSESGGRRTRRLYVIQEGVARPADDIESRVDALPEPEAPPAPAPARVEETRPAAAPAPEEPAKKGRFAFSRKKDAPTPAAPPAVEAPASKEPKLKLPFGKKEKAAPAPVSEPEPQAGTDEKPKKRFGFGRK